MLCGRRDVFWMEADGSLSAEARLGRRGLYELISLARSVYQKSAIGADAENAHSIPQFAARSISLPQQKSAPAAAPEVHPSRTLPTSTAPLLGRHRELAEVERSLQSSRVVTVTGPGGIGKTHLALTVATRAQTSWTRRRSLSLKLLRSPSRLKGATVVLGSPPPQLVFQYVPATVAPSKSRWIVRLDWGRLLRAKVSESG